MTSQPGLILRRFPYEEPDHINLYIWASDGVFSGGAEFYTRPEELAAIGSVLAAFPTKIPDEYRYNDREDERRSWRSRGFTLRAFTTDSWGHCALELQMEAVGKTSPHLTNSCQFAFSCEPSALERLGKLLVEFAKCQHLELHWSPELGGDELFNQHQT